MFSSLLFVARTFLYTWRNDLTYSLECPLIPATQKYSPPKATRICLVLVPNSLRKKKKKKRENHVQESERMKLSYIKK